MFDSKENNHAPLHGPLNRRPGATGRTPGAVTSTAEGTPNRRGAGSNRVLPTPSPTAFGERSVATPDLPGVQRDLQSSDADTRASAIAR